MTPEELLEALPKILDNIEEAKVLHETIESSLSPESVFYDIETQWMWAIESIQESAELYESWEDAFEDNYPGDSDEWRCNTCEDYQATIRNFSEYYEDWVESKASYCCKLSKGKILYVR